jgi:NADH-quinone oxidoreductase subunit L
MPPLVSHLWLIPALPLMAAALGALTPRSGRAFAAGTALLALAGSLVLSIAALSVALRSPGQHLYANFSWFELGAGTVRLGWLLDPLTAFLAVMVCFVGLLIFIFSLGYMREDANFARFFCFLSLFAAAMLGVLVANSLLLLFICWELVGLASYLLIGFWFHKPEAAAAAKKAFITTRIGDLGFLLGMLWLYDASGTLLFFDGGRGCLEAGALQGLAGATVGGLAVSTVIGLLIFCGAVGKSGQFPLHVWLPDAMEGPTPVSALIHAATMVAAGVFLIARVYPLVGADQALAAVPLHALTVVAFIGAITALLGAVIAVAQHDLKRVLAFSTISQLGYMMLALGVGSWTAAIFHLLTHAFFKALLFLGAGSVIASAHHEQDIRRLGGLGSRMRVTFATFAIGMMALSGVPFVFSGFWSKEAILHAASEWDVSRLPLLAGLGAVVLTAFYMTRLLCEVFLGRPRSEPAAHAHENPLVMTVPLCLLAAGAIGLGFLGTPAGPWLQSALSGSPVEPHSILDKGGLLGLSILLVALGLGSGWALYGRRPRSEAEAPDPLERAYPRLFGFLAARLKIDEFYAATFGRLARGLGALAVGLDQSVWGGGVGLVAGLGELAGRVNRRSDEGGLNAGFNAASERLRGVGAAYGRRQTGEAHGYLRTLAVAFLVLALIAILGGGR